MDFSFRYRLFPQKSNYLLNSIPKSMKCSSHSHVGNAMQMLLAGMEAIAGGQYLMAKIYIRPNFILVQPGGRQKYTSLRQECETP